MLRECLTREDSFARQGDRPSTFFEMGAVLALPAEQISGHLVLLRPSEVGWRMSFQALSDGNTVDACFESRTDPAIKEVKAYLRSLDEVEAEEMKRMVFAYCGLYEAAGEYHRSRDMGSMCACGAGPRKHAEEEIISHFQDHGIEFDHEMSGIVEAGAPRYKPVGHGLLDLGDEEAEGDAL